jgi:hypothetical protein
MIAIMQKPGHPWLKPWLIGRHSFAGLKASASTGRTGIDTSLISKAGRLVRVISFRSFARTARIFCLFVTLLTSQLWAQTSGGSLHGTVTDPSGAAVTKADVQVIASDGKIVSTTTNQTGNYEVKDLAPGRYGIRVSAKAFARYEVDGIVVGPGQMPKMDVALSIEVQQENVNVSEQGVGVDTTAENNATQMVISGKDLEALSDDPDELATDLQALAGPSAGPNGGQIYIDGFTGGQLPPKSSIREIRINQNPFSAEYDKLGYGRIEIFTKPGTDQYHGQVSVNGNSSYFNSTSPFATETPSYDSTQYTANFGGPIGKKTSFFINFERRNIGDNAIVNAFVLDPSLEQVPYNTAIPIPRTRTTVSPRMDLQLTANNTLSVRYQYWQDNQNNLGVGQFSLPTQAYNQSNSEQTFQISDTQLFGTKVVNETRFQYLRDRNNQRPAYIDATLNVQGAFVGGGNSAGYNIDNQDRYELQNYTSWLHGTHIFKFGGRLRAIRDSSYSNGNFNGAFTFNSLDEYQITEQGIAAGWTPTQIRNAGGGAGQFAITYGTPSAAVTWYDVGLYFSDDWRLKANLTLSYGLRFETQTDIHDHGDPAPRVSFAWGVGKGSNPSPKTVLRAGWGMFYDRFDEQYVLQADRLNGTTQQQYIVNQPNFYPIVPPPGSPLLNTAKTFPTMYQLAPNLRAAYTMQTAVSVERQISKVANVAVSYLNSRGVHQYLTRNINAPFPNTYNPDIPTSGIRPFGDVGNVYQYESGGSFEQNQLIVNANVKVGSKVSLFGWYTLNFVNGNTSGAGSFPNNQYDLAENYGPTPYDVHNRVFVGGTIAMPRGFRLSPFMVASSGIPFNITLGQDYNGDSIFNDRPTFATPGQTGQNIVATKWGVFNTTPQAGQTVIPPYYGTGPGRFSLNLRVSKTFGFGPETKSGGGMMGGPGGGRGRGPGGGFGGAMGGPMSLGSVTNRRYNLTFSINARNVFNNINYAPLVGNLSSPIFGQPNAIAGGPYGSAAAPRKIELQAMFNF